MGTGGTQRPGNDMNSTMGTGSGSATGTDNMSGARQGRAARADRN